MPRHLTNLKHINYSPWIHIRVTQITFIVHDLFNVCCNHTTINVQRTRIKNTQFATYIFDTSVTLKQSQSHQKFPENVDPRQVYNHSKFERSPFNGVKKKATLKVFSNEEICRLSPLNMCKKNNKQQQQKNPQNLVYSWYTCHCQQSYKVST